MKKEKNEQVLIQKKRRQQIDSHCWKFYYKKYGFDYTLINRQRVSLSRINKK